MAIEDFTTYTEVDPNSEISVAAAQIDYTNQDIGSVAYVYKDQGLDHFDGDFLHSLEMEVNSVDAGAAVRWMVWCVADAIGAFDELDANNDNSLHVLYDTADGVTPRLFIAENDGGAVSITSKQGIVLDTTYYLEIEKSGTNLALRIYSDKSRQTLLGTINKTIVDHDYQYSYGFQSRGGGTGLDSTGRVARLNLGEVTFVDDVVIPSVAIPTFLDFRTYVDALAIMGSSVVNERDLRTYVDALALTAVAQVSERDLQTFVDQLAIPAVTVPVFDDRAIRIYKEFLSVVTAANVTVRDLQTYIDSLPLTHVQVLNIVDAISQVSDVPALVFRYLDQSTFKYRE